MLARPLVGIRGFPSALNTYTIANILSRITYLSFIMKAGRSTLPILFRVLVTATLLRTL